jgi:predicted transcriptional regulator
MASTDLAVDIRSKLPPLSEEERDAVSTEDRRAEAFLLHSTGWTQTRIAKYFGVAQATVAKDLGIERQRRSSRAQNIEEEIGRILGVVEGVMVKAWERHNESAESNINSVAATNYLKIVLEAADRYATLSGFDTVKSAKAPQGKTRVIVQIGGSQEQPAIQVGVESES